MKDIEKSDDAAVGDPLDPSIHVPEDHVNELSFRAVEPVNVLVKDLNLVIDGTPTSLSNFATIFRC